MTAPLECAECGAPAAVAWSSIANGVDYDGSNSLVEISRVQCAAGHWYTHVGDFVRDPEDAERAEADAVEETVRAFMEEVDEWR